MVLVPVEDPDSGEAPRWADIKRQALLAESVGFVTPCGALMNSSGSQTTGTPP